MPHAINLFLVRHALSEANLDKSVNARLPDAKVPLNAGGHAQAEAAGDALVEFLLDPARNRFATPVRKFVDPGRTRILCSPYLRTRETAQGIITKLNDAKIEFDVREELCLREISFGLFDGIADEELPKHFPLEHAHYQKHVDFEGEFYAPMPLGESRAQVADRVKTVFGTILRDAEPRHNHVEPVKNVIIVSHGVTIRAFIMQWMHRTPEWYQAQTNPGNASITLISSGGMSEYKESLMFEGFRHIRTKQDRREEGNVQ